MARESDLKIEIENILREVDVPESAIDGVMSLISDSDNQAQQMIEKRNKDAETAEEIRIRMMDEPDWRKRASMAAMLISKSLE